MTHTLTVLFVFGGESSEHDVSINSARNVHAAIDKQRYDVLLCYIDRDGRWWLQDDFYDNPSEHRTTQLVVAPGTKTVLTIPGSKAFQIDVLFPVLHGKMGEDGTLQGLSAMLHVPFVGCGVEASALCMNKDTTKRLVETEGIPIVPSVTVRADEGEQSIRGRTLELDSIGPWFVKPSRAGSSVGVSKISDASDIFSAVESARKFDDIVLIEKAIIGRELEVAVLGNPPNHSASNVGEIIPGSDFYDYEDKYSADSTSKTLLNANLPPEINERIRQYALDAYVTLGCRGLARVDFLLSDDMVPYLNEVNTLPGFTDISMYPKLWQQEGVVQAELIDRLIAASLE